MRVTIEQRCPRRPLRRPRRVPGVVAVRARADDQRGSANESPTTWCSGRAGDPAARAVVDLSAQVLDAALALRRRAPLLRHDGAGPRVLEGSSATPQGERADLLRGRRAPVPRGAHVDGPRRVAIGRPLLRRAPLQRSLLAAGRSRSAPSTCRDGHAPAPADVTAASSGSTCCQTTSRSALAPGRRRRRQARRARPGDALLCTPAGRRLWRADPPAARRVSPGLVVESRTG